MKNEAIPCKLVSWTDIHRLSRQLTTNIRKAKFVPDLIIAIGRGGLVPGRLLSDLLDNMNLTSFKIEHYQGIQTRTDTIVRYPLNANVDNLRILLVDDVSDSGDTLLKAVEHVRSCGTPAEIRTAVLHHKFTSRYIPDFYSQALNEWYWLVYPWAIVEDIRNLMASMTPMPTTSQELSEKLKSDHDLSLSAEALADVIAADAIENPGSK